MAESYKSFAENKRIGEIDFSSLTIPDYQRPYRWDTRNVEELLSDIKSNIDKDDYRIGSLILHYDASKETINLVDGQQRITTLALIMRQLNYPTGFKAKYYSTISEQHIRDNNAFISEWLSYNMPQEERRNFRDFILNKCSVTWVQTDDLQEAFQMFDSQNGNGKTLLPYNLLKAYHFRAIDQSERRITVTDEKKRFDTTWEQAARFFKGEKSLDLLSLITQQLFQVRLWSRRLDAELFDNAKLQEFKGIQIDEVNKDIALPKFFLARLIYDKLYADGKAVDPAERNKYLSIDMSIINGKPFFDYVFNYVDAYKLLFLGEPKYPKLETFYNDYQKYCLYSSCSRTGDGYIRDLYQSLVLAVYDKFGIDGVNNYYKKLYCLAYRIRLEQSHVYQASVLNYPKELFTIISEATKLSDLQELNHYVSQRIVCKKMSEEDLVMIARYIKAVLGDDSILPYDHLSPEDMNRFSTI